MRRLALLAFVVSLVAAPAALADGQMPFAVQDGAGLVSADGSVRYVTLGAGQNTVLAEVSAKDGEPLRETSLLGSYGIPMLTGNVAADALSHDGKLIVVAGTALTSPSRFLVYGTRTMRLRNWLVLNGSFAFDALSPDASRLYLIQHTEAANGDFAHYVVRAYDLRTHRLLPGRVADRTQKSWVMNGYPVTRVTSADGRWVYTLYQNGGDGYPFVHALDTVRGVAHCIGLPLENQNGIYNLVLSLRDGGRTLAVHWLSGRPWLDVNTATWGISLAHGGTPWRWIGPGIAGAALLAAAIAALLLRRRLRQEVEEQSRDELRLAERQVVV
jgi:heme exporter protein D